MKHYIVSNVGDNCTYSLFMISAFTKNLLNSRKFQAYVTFHSGCLSLKWPISNGCQLSIRSCECRGKQNVCLWAKAYKLCAMCAHCSTSSNFLNCVKRKILWHHVTMPQCISTCASNKPLKILNANVQYRVDTRWNVPLQSCRSLWNRDSLQILHHWIKHS